MVQGATLNKMDTERGLRGNETAAETQAMKEEGLQGSKPVHMSGEQGTGQ